VRARDIEGREGETDKEGECSSSLLLSSLELSDTQVYAPYIRALLGTASHFCEVVVLKLGTVPQERVCVREKGAHRGWTTQWSRTPEKTCGCSHQVMSLCKATWKREFKQSWREDGPPNHHDDKVVSDQYVVNKELSLSASLCRSFHQVVSTRSRPMAPVANHLRKGTTQGSRVL